MSGTTPPEGPVDPGRPTGPYDQSGPHGDGQPPGPPGSDDVVTIGGTEPSGSRRGPKIVAGVAALALVVGGGAFAMVRADPFNLFSSGPQAAEALPADAIGYFGIDLDPAATQKIDALRFLNHFPEFKAEFDLDDRDDVRKELLSDLLDDLDCDVTYDDDVEPWLGHKFGGALLPGEDADGRPIIVAAIETTDTDAAGATIEELNACDPGDGAPGYAVNGDYLLLSNDQDTADDAAAAADDASLADDDDFRADLEALGGDGIATAWLDVAALTEEEGMIEEMFGASAPTDTDEAIAAAQKVDARFAMAFRFDHDHVELVSVAHAEDTMVDYDSNPVVGLPDSTVFAMSMSGGADWVDQAWDNLLTGAEESGEDLDGEIADFEAETGFSVPDDLETLFGDNLMLALGSEDGELGLEAFESGDVSALDVGLRFTGDHDELRSLYDQIMSLAEQGFGGQAPFVDKDFDDGLVVASNDDYADALADLDGGLGDDESFRSVVPDAADQQFVLYVDFDAIEDAVIEGVEASGAPADAPDNIRPLRAFGFSFGAEGDYATSTIRLSVND